MGKKGLGPTERHCVMSGRRPTNSTLPYSPTSVESLLTDVGQAHCTKKGWKQQKYSENLVERARKLEKTNLAFDQDRYFFFLNIKAWLPQAVYYTVLSNPNGTAR